MRAATMTKQLNIVNNKERTIEFPKWANNETWRTIGNENNREPAHWCPRSNQVTGNSQVTGEIMWKKKKIFLQDQEHNTWPNNDAWPNNNAWSNNDVWSNVLWSSSAPTLFSFSLPFTSHNLLSPDLSPDPCHLTEWSSDLSYHMTTFYCSHPYCLVAYCLPSMETLLSLGLLFCLSLFCFAIVFVLIVPRALLFILLGHLVMVAASVVYKLCLYHRRGLKPDLVF